jgi:hypothetical protein
MKRVVAAAILTASALASGPAGAGAVLSGETHVDTVNRVAYGNLPDTRNSADSTQYIGCWVLGVAGSSTTVDCSAEDAASQRLRCSSADPELVKVAQAITDTSHVYFKCDASNKIQLLYTNKSSVFLP